VPAPETTYYTGKKLNKIKETISC